MYLGRYPRRGTPRQVHLPGQVPPKAGTPPRQVHPRAGTPTREVHPLPGRYTPDGHCSGRYASYWNTFLLIIYFLFRSGSWFYFYFPQRLRCHRLFIQTKKSSNLETLGSVHNVVDSHLIPVQNAVCIFQYSVSGTDFPWDLLILGEFYDW